MLVALCRTAPSISNPIQASTLLEHLAPYASECSSQAISSSPAFRDLASSPWEVLTKSIFHAQLQIGIRHSAFRQAVAHDISAYLKNAAQAATKFSRADFGESSQADRATKNRIIWSLVALATSLLGFLEAAKDGAAFWSPDGRLDILSQLQSILSEGFLVATEAACSAVRNSRASGSTMKDLRTFFHQYDRSGRPIGSLLIRHAFSAISERCAALMVVSEELLARQPVLSALLSHTRLSSSHRLHMGLLEKILDISVSEISSVDEGSDYLRLGPTWQQQRAQALKASCLTSYLCCTLIDPVAAEDDVLLVWLEKIISDPMQLADETLGSSALRCLARLAVSTEGVAPSLSRSLPRIIVQRSLPHTVAVTAAQSLLYVLRLLSQDSVVTTLWGLGNSISANPDEPHMSYNPLDENGGADAVAMNGTAGPQMSSVSLVPTSDGSGKTAANHHNVILTIVTIAQGYNDQKITALAMSLLIQKMGRVSPAVDLKVISEASLLSPKTQVPQFKALLRAYTRITHDAIVQGNEALLTTVGNSLSHIGMTLKGGTELYGIFLEHLLRNMISKGDVPTGSQQPETASSAQELAVLIRPLSLLISNNVATERITETENFPGLQRDAWYNFVVHGFGLTSRLGQEHLQELKVIAKYCEPLISEERADALESPIELNIVLKRGASSQSASKQRDELVQMLPKCESDIRKLDYPEAIFLKTAHFVETLRASAGNCFEILSYFVDPRLQGTALGNCLAAVALGAVEETLQTTSSGRKENLSAPFMAQQLSVIFEYCCHRVQKVQEVAFMCAERIISTVPSALCQKSSVFALLDLLTIMWSSCLEAETNEYEWRTEWEMPGGHVKIRLSDNFAHRRWTLNNLHRRAKEWVLRAMNIAPLDVKGLLQTYLSDYREDDAFGHVSLGRSFAVEMGAAIPGTDARLGAIESGYSVPVNTASDFVAQYTSRQEYRYTDPSRSDVFEGNNMLDVGRPGLTPANSGLPQKDSRELPGSQAQGGDPIGLALRTIHQRITRGHNVPFGALRDVLRLAASLLCRAKDDQNSIISLFVRIPFMLFTKQSIKLGLSLWMGVIKENARMESRLLIEIIENWIATTHAHQGMFDSRLFHTDPFYLKEEYAPSDLEAIAKQQQRVHDRLAPHFRIFQFLESHYSATRLNGTTAEKSLLRLLQITLRSLHEAPNHPLSRELHFHVVLLALRVLRFSTTLERNSRARFRDQILSAGLTWFSNPARWSFGGSRVQVKAELQLLTEVMNALSIVKDFSALSVYTAPVLKQKQELLELLISSEQIRLGVWLFPLEPHAKQLPSASQKRNPSEESLIALLQTAWNEDPSLAINVSMRFQAYHRLQQHLRKLILDDPRKCLDEPEALRVMFGEALPNDVSSQLRFLVYWAPVNPITAVTYFLPAYGNHPCIIQYAVRALESHSVDITFFYVPQIVQTLRYDALGYVELYIVETAKFSQLFAHQIIWNIKANSYKDEDSQEPDPMKPTLDHVTERLLSSFIPSDKDFYEREFSFFNEITGISGKLRPFLKKPKPEKKAKIEEELRKIHVDVGVYLPSNPDGVVVGIDRTSGKPLQSHAKTPYMATFRIRKERTQDDDDMPAAEGGSLSPATTKTSEAAPANSYEIWQSAIFKVGDDCRQDLLALQMIAAFRGIFANVGLPLYVFPYRVTATAPGCGVIDVLPRSISRDMLGREAVNGLYPWFLSKFGSEDSPAFQGARANFVKSLAAYSIISYLLQFKDRHNGNIMFDDEGHILHIDFGFCFDIAPGGVRFERAPFKLTREMLAVMGGTTDSQSFHWFEELAVKAFLAARAHVATLAHIVVCMLDSGLPCFKPETISHFRERFVLDKTERDAAEYVRFLIRKSLENKSTYVYDEFQLLTNGIPF